LGLTEPWEVGRVTLQREPQEIEVAVRCLETVWGCPTCGRQMRGHGQEERCWRHLDSCQFKTMVVCAVPRVRWLEHGTQQVAVPRAEPRSRFTRLFERMAGVGSDSRSAYVADQAGVDGPGAVGGILERESEPTMDGAGPGVG
jgi:hypothetical protein